MANETKNGSEKMTLLALRKKIQGWQTAYLMKSFTRDDTYYAYENFIELVNKEIQTVEFRLSELEKEHWEDKLHDHKLAQEESCWCYHQREALRGVLGKENSPPH